MKNWEMLRVDEIDKVFVDQQKELDAWKEVATVFHDLVRQYDTYGLYNTTDAVIAFNLFKKAEAM